MSELSMEQIEKLGIKIGDAFAAIKKAHEGTHRDFILATIYGAAFVVVNELCDKEDWPGEDFLMRAFQLGLNTSAQIILEKIKDESDATFQ